MINLLWNNVLYPEVNKATSLYVVTEKDGKSFIAIEGDKYNKPLALDVLSHPHVKELLEEYTDEKEKLEVSLAIVYQVFNLICQMFSGKTVIEGKLVDVETKLISLDSALFNLQKSKNDAN